MKKSYLAAAAILGAAVLGGEAHAVKIDLGKVKFKMGFRSKIHASYKGARNDNDVSDLVIEPRNARIYGKGSIGKIIKWVFQGDFTGRISDLGGQNVRTGGQGVAFRLVDNFIAFDFAKEFKIVAGQVKLPFELHSGIQSGWSFVAPTGPGYGLQLNPFTNPNPRAENASGSNSRSPQILIWGKVAEGLFKYYLGVVDGDDEVKDEGTSTGVVARIELAPTMLGYKGHPGIYLKETYVGKQNTLVLGLAYYNRKIAGLTATSYSVDLLWEQNFGSFVPNISVGYVVHDNFAGNLTSASGSRPEIDVNGLLIQGQLLFNTKTFLGKPAIAVRWAQSDIRRDTTNTYGDSSVFGVTLQLYPKGVSNRIALSVDNVRRTNRSWTDVTLALWYNF